MAGFLVANAVKRGLETVDSRFSALVEPNLFPDQVFQPNITFTDKYEIDATGQIFVRKLGNGTVDTSSALTFTHTQVADSLLSIVLDKPFKLSEPIYEAVDVARTSGTGVQKFENLMMNIKKSWQTQAMTSLLAGATATADVTITSTAALAKSTFIAARKQLKDGFANPDVMICSTRYFTYLLDYSGREYQPNFNDEVMRTGSIGKFLGVNVYESALLTDTGVTGSTEFVLYDHEAYSIVTSLIAARIVDAGKDWVGSAAQAHLISGFLVTTAARVYKKVLTVA